MGAAIRAQQKAVTFLLLLITKIFSMLGDGLKFARENDPATIWKEITRRDGHPFIQFIKYGCCGVLAVIVHSLTFWWMGSQFFEVATMVDGRPKTLPSMVWPDFVVAQTIGFFAANVAAYLTNLAFVFTGGRHNRVLEFLIFTAVSSIGHVSGLALSIWNINYGEGSSTWLATAILIITSMMVNFVCRKFIIFKG